MATKLKTKFDIDDLIGNVRSDIEDAVNFVSEEFDEEFDKGDRYFNGEVDIEVNEGRSAVVATVVRDSIRNIRPSIMRVLASNRKKLVQYIPSTVAVAAVVEQQEVYVHHLFWKNNGYQVLYDATDETLKHRYAPVKTYWNPNPDPEFVRFTGMTDDEVQYLSEMPDVEVLSVDAEDHEDDPSRGADGEQISFNTVEAVRTPANGSIVMEAVPYGEFFISRNARSVTTARVHGHRRSVTVADAIELGLDYDDWELLDDLDTEEGTENRRQYDKRDEQERGDLLAHRFLLTECYVYMDLDDLGYEQLYCLYLGGTNYEMLAEPVREGHSPFDIICHDPRAFTVVGTSIPDVTIQQQDVQSSMLRGMVDNVHLVNNPRLAGNPAQVNFDDLMQHDMGYPVRVKGQGPMIQTIEVASQLQSTLPLLQYLDLNSQGQVGVTRAAQGLDPGAMQSTDKQAVQNTIQLSQGQIELCVRNIIETGVIGIFRKLLRLSIQHLDRYQVVRMRGMLIPVDQIMFDPDLYAQPQVGLGAISEEQRLAGLTATLQQQQTIMTTLGADNPFVTMSHIYNTLEDLTEAYGLYDVSRYYNMVTPEIEAQFAAQRAKQAEEAAKKGAEGGMDPAAALIQVEELKAQTEKLKIIAQDRAKNVEMQLKALELNAKDDLERDKMAQDRALKSAELAANSLLQVDQNEIKREQNAVRAPLGGTAPSGGPSAPSASQGTKAA